MKINSHDDFKRVIYTFQGGGALGAYQAGVFQGLTESGHYEPNWIIGTSIGAFNAGIIAGNPPKKHGKACFFDNQEQTITIDHILARGALPPGFPSVKIEGKYYWDGGIFNNSPFTALLNEPVNKKTICFVNNVFDSFGLLPKSLDDVLKRHKDIIYSSHLRSNIYIYKIVHGLRYILSHLFQHIPDKLKKNLELQDLMHLQKKLLPSILCVF